MAYSRDTVKSPKGHSSLVKGVYDPRAFVLHAASLGHTFVHCPRFSTAASRRSLDSISVPMWLTILSDQLIVVGLVGRYPTNYLIIREPLHMRLATSLGLRCQRPILPRITRSFDQLSGTYGQVIHVLLTRSPLRNPKVRRSTCMPNPRRQRSS